MAKVSPAEYRKERAERGGGEGGNYPKYTKGEGKMPFACLSIAHTRGKEKGTWGVAFLLLCVDGDQRGTVTVHKAWTEKMVHQIIAGAFGYDQPYENGLPSAGQDPNRFDADPGLIDEMISIVTCGDQKESAGPNKGKWLAGVPVQARRAPYITVTMAVSTYKDTIYEPKYLDPIKERGTDGPYYVGTYRDVMMDGAIRKQAVEWFDAKCEKEVREANEAARARGGGRQSSEDRYEPEDDGVPF